MTKQIGTGNEAVAWGALRAGVRVVTGYPGTPSTDCIEQLLTLDLSGRHVEWSTNEKVAFEIAAGAAWAGHRALCTMKMTGLNVAYDAVVSIAYSGTNGGLVLYVADDPGVSAGMAEQDTRGFARMACLPTLEPASPAEAYALVQAAFELSEAVGTPVLLRLTTAVALAHTAFETEEPTPPREIEPILEKDIARYTKAGAAICQAQHRDLLARLDRAETWIRDRELNRLTLSEAAGGLGIVAVGVANAPLSETLAASSRDASVLAVRTSIPFPTEEAARLLEHCATVAVLEELEPHVERDLRILAQRTGWVGRIAGKLDGTSSPIGELGVDEVLAALRAADAATSPARERPQAVPTGAGFAAPRPITVCAGAGRRSDDLTGESSRSDGPATVLPSADLAAPRPITVCAGCPHRGTYLAIDAAIRRVGLNKDEVMVTGDIGCTILGMNPPFDLLWNEVSMGSSIGLAQGYVHAGLKTPVIATIGDSTFFHGGIPGLVNAIQHRVPLTLVVLDNGWTAMTGMQANPGTDEASQNGGRRIDLEQVIRGLGVERLFVVDPYDLEETTDAVTECLRQVAGVSVVIARRECAIQARRRGVAGRVTVDPEKCVLCRRCIQLTGCPALSIREEKSEDGQEKAPAGGFSQAASIEIDAALCNGCGLCVSFCPTHALAKETAE